MVALRQITKTEQAHEARQHYIETATVVEINADGNGSYALVKSEVSDEMYTVRFDETSGAPLVSSCECKDHYYRHSFCKHMEVLDRYFTRIHTAMHPVMVALDTQVTMPFPIGSDDMDALVAQLDEEEAAMIAVELSRDCPMNAVVEKEVIEVATPDFSALYALTVGDYQKWLRKQIRAFGRRAELGDAQIAPVEAFVRETTGIDFNLSAGGYVEVYVGTATYEFFTGATDLAYGLYYNDDYDGNLIIKAGKALDVALLSDANAKLVIAPVVENAPVAEEQLVTDAPTSAGSDLDASEGDFMVTQKDRESDNHQYIVWIRGEAVRLTWRQMSNQERAWQIEAERRAAYEQEFQPNGAA